MIKTEKLSKYALTVCTVIIIASFAAFFGVGYDNPVGDYNEPQLTELIIYLMYALTLVAAVLAVWSVGKSVKENLGYSGENLSGVPGGKVSAISLIIMIASLVVGYVCGLGETEFVAADGTVTSATMVTVSDMFIISIYILMIVAALCVAVNMTGLLKKR